MDQSLLQMFSEVINFALDVITGERQYGYVIYKIISYLTNNLSHVSLNGSISHNGNVYNIPTCTCYFYNFNFQICLWICAELILCGQKVEYIKNISPICNIYFHLLWYEAHIQLQLNDYGNYGHIITPVSSENHPMIAISIKLLKGKIPEYIYDRISYLDKSGVRNSVLSCDNDHIKSLVGDNYNSRKCAHRNAQQHSRYYQSQNVTNPTPYTDVIKTLGCP